MFICKHARALGSVISSSMSGCFNRSRLGVLSHPTKLCKKLVQLDVFEHEDQYRTTFARFVDDDLQRFIPRRIPLNDLGLSRCAFFRSYLNCCFSVVGINEVLHQLQMNIDRLGPVLTLLLIDSLQQLIHSGVLLTMHRTPGLKGHLMQLIEHIQSARCNGVYLERLMEQMTSSLQLTSMKKVLFTNQLNTLLHRNKTNTSNGKVEMAAADDRGISTCMALAYQGQLVTCLRLVNNEQRSDLSANKESVGNYNDRTSSSTLHSLMSSIFPCFKPTQEPRNRPASILTCFPARAIDIELRVYYSSV